MVESPVDLLKTQLRNEISVNIKREWLVDCYNYFKETNPQISQNELYYGTKQQILLANIEDVCTPVIPHEFKTKKDIWIMNSRLFLQMNSIVEITESFYDQWQRLHNLRLDEVNEIKESKSFPVKKKKRCLKLILFDGKITIEAMELLPIPCLNTKLHPGVKVLISGPVKVSNKIILLEAKNIEIVGGEVEELLIENAYENILLKLLRRPITATPITNYVEEKLDLENNHPKPQQPPPPNPANNKPQEKRIENPLRLSIDDSEIDFDFLEQIEAAEREFQKKEEEKQKKDNSQAVARKQSLIDLTQEQEKFIVDDMIIAVPSKSIETSTMPSTSNSSVNSSVPLTSSWSSYDKNSNSQKSSSKPTAPAPKSTFTNPWNPSKKVPPKDETKKTFFNNFYEAAKPLLPEKKIPIAELTPKNDNDDYEMLEITESTKRKSGDNVLSPIHKPKAQRIDQNKATLLDDDYEYKINYTYNFVLIDEFVKLRNLDKLKRTFVVEATIVKVHKIRVDKIWVLQVEISDEWSKEHLMVSIDDEIVTGFAGHSAQEMLHYQQKIKVQPQLREELTKILTRVSDAIKGNKFLMTLTTKLHPPNKFEVSVLKFLEKTEDCKRCIMLKNFDLGIMEN